MTDRALQWNHVLEIASRVLLNRTLSGSRRAGLSFPGATALRTLDFSDFRVPTHVDLPDGMPLHPGAASYYSALPPA